MLSAWILSLMIALQPEAPWRGTYDTTADAIAQAVSEQPSLFPNDPDGREKTAAVLVAVAWFESRFKPDAVGGGGRFRGLYQIGGHGPQSNVLETSRLALTLFHESFKACEKRPVDERLARYTGGATQCREASADSVAKSRYRMAKARWLVKNHPPPAPVADAAASP